MPYQSSVPGREAFDHPVVVAEAGTCNHNLDWAHVAVMEAAKAGCWGFKVQMLNWPNLVVPGARRYDRLGGEAQTQADLFRGALPYSAWGEVKQHCDDVGLVFLASCWDLVALAALGAMGCDWVKVGSGDITYLPLLRTVARTGMGVMLSTGASTWTEIERALDCLEGTWDEEGIDPPPLVVMACTLEYPCPPSDAALSRIAWLDRETSRGSLALPEVYIGYSDHTDLLSVSGLAVAAGAIVMEKHFTVTPGIGGDHDFALSPDGMLFYVDHAARAWELYGPEACSFVLPGEMDARVGARRCLYALDNCRAGVSIGTLLAEGKAAWLRPLSSDPIPPHLERYQGHPLGEWRLKRDLAALSPIELGDITI